MFTRVTLPALLVLVPAVLLVSCAPADSSNGYPASKRTIYIPAVNEEYAPRDIQAMVQIEQAYLDASPAGPPSAEPLNAIVFNVNWRTMAPTRRGPYDSDAAATVSLRVVPAGALAGGLDPRRSDYSPYKMFAGGPISDHAYGLARRTNNRQSRQDGPIDELFTLENNRFDFLIDCHDPGNEARRFCSMMYLTRPSGDLAKSEFAMQTAIVFHRNVLPQWREIRSSVEKFVEERTAFVPFRADR